jgi:hypothetical protein
MISEKTFIRYYSSFWSQLLPGVDHYIRMINSGLKERSFTPITLEDIPTRRAIINGIAFKLFYNFKTDAIPYKELKRDSKELLLIKKSEVDKMSFLNNSQDFERDINKNELQIIIELINRLVNYSETKKGLKIYPEFQGCGLLFNCYGDLLFQDTLIEVKAGNSSFGRQDLYQLLTYGALNYISSNNINLKKFELINIRTGIQWQENIESVCEIIGGASSSEIYSEIVNYISNNYRSI